MTAGRWAALGAAVVAALGLGAGPARAATAPHVVGGTAAVPAAPFVAAVTVIYPTGVAATCGGTLVAARYVVTAGHCVAPDITLGGAPVRADVVLGAADVRTDSSAERFTGAAIIRNPAFSTGGLDGSGAPVNDVAVLRLPAASAKTAARLPRPSDGALWAPGTPALAYGYGLTDPDDDRSASAQQLQVDLPIADDASCRAVYGSDFDGSDLCAGGQPGKDTCQGDSGGPLVVADPAGTVPVLAGVTSYGDRCGRTYGVYTEVGGDVNAFLRSVIPQVELDAPAGTPVAGADVTVTAAAADPDGQGPFGGYDALAWDLDGDGAFDDATGATATRRLAAGANAIAVRATDAAGNRETRALVVTARRLAARLTLSGRRALRLRGRRFTVTATPNQAGRVTATVRRGGRLLGRATAIRPRSAAARRLTLTLTRAGLRRLPRGRGTRVVVRATLTPSAGGAARTVRRTVTLRR